MTYPWEYFEQLEEVVYVSDPETYELVYLNQYARGLLGIEDESYRGKPCYSVIQGLERPCLFCTNPQLEEGKFLSWSYRNPVVNTTFEIEDTMLVFEGKRYRLEFAYPERARERGMADRSAFLHYETMVNECLRILHSTNDLDEALERLLEYLGEQLRCRAVRLYESKLEQWVVNTYAWSVDGCAPDRELLKIDYADYLLRWYQSLDHNEPLLFRDVKDLCRRRPGLCKFLGSSGMDRMIVVPLVDQKRVVGFLRLDEPPEELMDFAAGICKVLAYYFISVMRQRDLIGSLEQASRHDQLTGALNRYAIQEQLERERLERDTGLIYSDVIGLKRVNDQQGHASGDRLILQAYHLLVGAFPRDQVFRMGGDEFLVVCQDVDRETFQQNVERLREMLAESGCGLSVGTAWAKAGEIGLRQLVEQADSRMYEEKKSHYAQQGQEGPVPQTGLSSAESRETSRLREFLQRYYFDADSFFQSVALADTSLYLYCGDLRQNIYYISDNLRDEFGFEDNLVYGFVEQLEGRIYEPDRAAHHADMEAMEEEGQTRHDVRYRIHNKRGELVWMRCQGLMKWASDGSGPIFFSGSMIKLKNEAEIDPVTGLMHFSYAIKRLPALQHWEGELSLLCIICRNFSDINRAFGRSTGDSVLLEVAGRLGQELESKMQLFRMDGARFLAVVRGGVETEALTREIQRVVKEIYHKYGIELMYPCAIGVLHSSGGHYVLQGLADHAAVAAHVAKSAPGRDYVEFTPQMLQPYQEQSDLNLGLNYSINHGFEGFRIVVQPQVRAEDGYILGGEVLLRWQDQGQNVTPDKFIPLLEKTGLILPVGKWVLKQALRVAGQILKERPDFLISVNVSYLQVLDQSLFDTIQELLHQYRVPPYNLILELTESHFDEMPDYLERFVRQCRGIGIHFALDDFGTAYSFLQLLLQYPADLVKLDRSLVREITASDAKRSFVESIVEACHSFGKQVCMEGVETEEELHLVRQMQCDLIQGFYFYRPMELQDLYPLLSRSVLEEGKSGPDREEA